MNDVLIRGDQLERRNKTFFSPGLRIEGFRRLDQNLPARPFEFESPLCLRLSVGIGNAILQNPSVAVHK